MWQRWWLIFYLSRFRPFLSGGTSLSMCQRTLILLNCFTLVCPGSPIPMSMFFRLLHVDVSFFAIFSYILFLYIYFSFSIFHRTDSGVFFMMFLEHWESPRSMIANLFEEKDIPNIRVKVSNDLVFSHKNAGKKILVTNFDEKV